MFGGVGLTCCWFPFLVGDGGKNGGLLPKTLPPTTGASNRLRPPEPPSLGMYISKTFLEAPKEGKQF